jgi:hypothetical protein
MSGRQWLRDQVGGGPWSATRIRSCPDTIGRRATKRKTRAFPGSRKRNRFLRGRGPLLKRDPADYRARALLGPVESSPCDRPNQTVLTRPIATKPNWCVPSLWHQPISSKGHRLRSSRVVGLTLDSSGLAMVTVVWGEESGLFWQKVAHRGVAPGRGRLILTGPYPGCGGDPPAPALGMAARGGETVQSPGGGV